MGGAAPAGKSFEELSAQLADLRARVGADISFCLFQKDRHGRLIWVNEECCQFIGRPADEVIGRTDFDLFPPAFAYKYRDDDRRVMNEERAFRSFESVNGGDGSAKAVYIVKVPDRDDQGRVNGVLGAFWASAPLSDVEVHLHQSESRLRAIIDHLPVMVCAVDENGLIVYGNHECERLTGYSPAEIVGNPRGLALLYPDDKYRATILEEMYRDRGIRREWELTLTRRDGQWRTIIWSDVSLDCPIAGWASWGIGVDVTEKNQALAILDAIRVAQHCYIAKASPAELFEQLLQRLLGVTRSEFGVLGEVIALPTGGASFAPHASVKLSADDSDDLKSLYQTILSSGQTSVINRGDLVAATNRRIHSFLGAPLRHDGKLVGLACIANRPGGYDDRLVNALAPLLATYASLISFLQMDRQRQVEEENRRHLEAQLQYAQKLESLGILAGGIAHDFNNLLVSILGHASLAAEDMSLSSSGRECLRQIETAAVRAADLCKQMLAYSGKGRFVVIRLDLSELVEEMLHLLQVTISKKVVLRCNLVKDLPPIEADATQIRQVLMNLIANAAEACGDKSGMVTISTGVMNVDREYLATTFLSEQLQEGPFVFVEVSDTGCGMDEATRSRIYDPFFTTKSTGRGLGLAAVLGIVRGHRGAIKCYSEVNRGTTFKVLIPAAAGQAEPLQQKKPAASMRATGTILVVDDEEGIRGLVQRILERVGFKVIVARDGREGVEVFKLFQDEIILVLLDMTMPYLSGDEVFREMRKLRENVRVILSSGYNEQEATNRFVGKGLAGFLQKPYRPSDLIDMVTRVLAPESGMP